MAFTMMLLKLMDNAGMEIGEVRVTEEDDVVLGEFHPTSAFSMYASLFKSHEQAVNDQLFVEVNRLEAAIDSFGFYVIDPCNERKKSIADLQIMGAGMSFRWM